MSNKKPYLISLKRDSYTAQSTHGMLYFGTECDSFSYTLEDTVRADGIKVYGKTAIKGGTENKPELYNLTVHFSNKFKRDVIMLSNTNKSHLIKHGNVEFGYVYVHGGNAHEDSLGCILCAKNRLLSRDKIQGTMERAFTEKVKALLKQGPVKLAVINLTQNK